MCLFHKVRLTHPGGAFQSSAGECTTMYQEDVAKCMSQLALSKLGFLLYQEVTGSNASTIVTKLLQVAESNNVPETLVFRLQKIRDTFCPPEGNDGRPIDSKGLDFEEAITGLRQILHELRPVDENLEQIDCHLPDTVYRLVRPKLAEITLLKAEGLCAFVAGILENHYSSPELRKKLIEIHRKISRGLRIAKLRKNDLQRLKVKPDFDTLKAFNQLIALAARIRLVNESLLVNESNKVRVGSELNIVVERYRQEVLSNHRRA